MSKYANFRKLMKRPDDISALTQKDVDASIQSLGEGLAKGRGIQADQLGEGKRKPFQELNSG